MRMIVLATILFFTTMNLTAGENKTNSTPTKQKPVKTNYQVTFIELGSVNCVPCKMMQPVMKQIEKDYEGIVKVVFYDVWTAEQRPKAAEYGIRAIPTQVFLDANGKEFFRHVGYFPFEEIEKILSDKGIKKKKSEGAKKQGNSSP